MTFFGWVRAHTQGLLINLRVFFTMYRRNIGAIDLVIVILLA